MRAGLAALVALAGVVAAAGCGTGGPAKGGDATRGKQLFVGKCGACHVLAAAGTQGRSGPSLDAAFATDRREGFKESTIRNVVLDQIRIAIPPMPANIYRGQDAQDVAAYVASVAGASGAEAAPAKGGGGTSGKQLFQSNCASCHTLADANATGNVGPNLDQLKPAFPVVKRQVTNGGAAMPAFKGQLSPSQIDAVAKYVASAAGKKK